MATIIEQKPLYPQVPVGQEVIFVVSNNTIVGSQTNVRFIADVYISNTTPSSISTSTIPAATFKTTPNNAGVGIFDFKQVVENYVSADNMAANISSYKGTATTDNTPHPLHLIDKYSRNKKAARWLTIQFKTQYTDANGDIQIVDLHNSIDYLIFNGYLKYSDELSIFNNDFGFDLGNFNLSSPTDKFLTNAPATQYANIEDYGTLAFLSPNDNLSYIRLQYNDSSGSQIGTEDITRNYGNGAYTNFTTSAVISLLYFGCYPGNLMRDGSSTFAGLVSAGTIQGGSIVVQAFSSSGAISKEYTININCPNLKGYESIRLCWLNQWGAWDYYLSLIHI